MKNEYKKYIIQNKEVIFAKTEKQFVNRLRKGSYFDSDCTNTVYKIKFAERFEMITGKKIDCAINDDVAFVAELKKHGFIISVTIPRMKLSLLN